MIVKVTDYIDGTQAITADDGQKIYRAICAGLNARGGSVTVDFTGVRIVCGPFMNTSLGQLLKVHDSDLLNDRVHIEQFPITARPALATVLRNAKRYYDDGSD